MFRGERGVLRVSCPLTAAPCRQPPPPLLFLTPDLSSLSRGVFPDWFYFLVEVDTCTSSFLFSSFLSFRVCLASSSCSCFFSLVAVVSVSVPGVCAWVLIDFCFFAYIGTQQGFWFVRSVYIPLALLLVLARRPDFFPTSSFFFLCPSPETVVFVGTETLLALLMWRVCGRLCKKRA